MSQDYMFLADEFGLQSLCVVDPGSFHAALVSCDANPQRMQVFGTITLEPEIYEGMLSLMSSKEGCIQALKMVKSTTYNLPRSHITRFKRHLNIIPNPLYRAVDLTDEEREYWLKRTQNGGI